MSIGTTLEACQNTQTHTGILFYPDALQATVALQTLTWFYPECICWRPDAGDPG